MRLHVAHQGDKCGMGLGATVGAVLRHPKFLVDPHTAASEVWTHTGRRIAANGAVMRTSILGTSSNWYCLVVVVS